jgi:hypothetical protein
MEIEKLLEEKKGKKQIKWGQAEIEKRRDKIIEFAMKEWRFNDEELEED